MATNFGLTVNSPDVNIIQSINYLLATQGTSTGNANVQVAGNVVQINANTGQIYNSNVGVISYLYGYIDIAYANTATGGGFSTNSINKSYYGIHNAQTPTYDSNPADYQWTQVSGGFGTTKGLYYQTSGGNTINFYIGTSAPSIYYTPVIDSTPILLALVGNSSVVANSIQPKAITNVQIASNTIQGQNIQLGTITANLLAVGTIIVANSIQSNNAIFGNTSSPGYWLDSNTGNVRFGGNTSIGSNLTVGNNVIIGGNASIAGILTAGSLNANIVTTNSLQLAAATQVVTVADNTSYPLINFTNGNSTIGSPNYLWPPYTRGFAIGGGATIVPTTNGSSSGSAITVQYNALINTVANSTVQSYNLVELWKSGSSTYYKDVFQAVRSQTTYDNSNVAVDTFMIPGNYGSFYVGQIGTITSIATNTTNNFLDVSNAWLSSIYRTPTGAAVTNNSKGGPVYGQSGTFFYTYVNSQSANTTNTYTGTLGSWSSMESGGSPTTPALPEFNAYGVVSLSSIVNYSAPGNNTWNPSNPVNAYNAIVNIVVGSGGTIYYRNYTGADAINSGTISILQSEFETSSVYADLIDIACDLPNSFPYYIPSTPSPTFNFVAVGTGGVILYNARTWQAQMVYLNSTTGWTQASSPTINTLNAVASNAQITGPVSYTRANTWVAVGNAGTVVTSGSPSGPWSLANSVPTTNNLNSVGYTNGTWVAVGDAGTIITSTDGTNWIGPISNPASSLGRNLYGVGGGMTNHQFVAGGEEIIISSTTDPTYGGWSNVYVGGASISSALTRLQYQGSWANIANVSQPPAQQQITNGQIISGTYTDINYTAGSPITYYLVLGNMYGYANIYTNGPNMTVTEIKR